MDEELSIRARLSEVLDVGMQFFYEYDYGSPTDLVLEVVALREQGLPKGAVQLLARNEPPQVSCQRCSHPARHPNLHRMRVEWGGLAL
jgi:hypothetical protein